MFLIKIMFIARLLLHISFRAVRYSMQVPNKLYSYNNSTFALLPVLLDVISKGSLPATDLYLQIRNRLKDPTDFLSAMDCLYALRAIDMDENGKVFVCLKK